MPPSTINWLRFKSRTSLVKTWIAQSHRLVKQGNDTLVGCFRSLYLTAPSQLKFPDEVKLGTCRLVGISADCLGPVHCGGKLRAIVNLILQLNLMTSYIGATLI